MPVFGPLQLLPSDFRSNDVTSASLPVTWGHMTSFAVTWLFPTASYRLIGGEMYSICHFSAHYSRFQVTSVKSRHFWVASSHLRSPESFPTTWLPPPESYSLVGSEMYSNASFRPSTATSRWLRSNDVTFGSLLVTWGYVTSFPAMWLPPPGSYSLVLNMYSIRHFSALYSHFQVTSGQMTSLPGHIWSPEITWRHFLSRHCILRELLPCRKWNVQYMPVFGPLQPLPGNFRANDVTSGHIW